MSAFNGAQWALAILYGVAAAMLFGRAALHGLGHWMPKRLRERVSEADQPLWRRYQTISCLVLAVVFCVLLATQLSTRGACLLSGSPAFLVQVVGICVLVLSCVADFFASKRFTGRWWG